MGRADDDKILGRLSATVDYLLTDMVAAIRQVGADFRSERDDLRADDGKYIGEYRDELIAGARSKAADKLADYRAQIAERRAVVQKEIRDARDAARPDGAEAVALRIEMADARSRVRELLGRADVSAVLDRAVENRDRLMIEALREEIAWLDLTPTTLGDAIAAELGDPAEDTGQYDRDPVLRRVDQALVPLLPAKLADAVAADLALDEGWPLAELHIDAAGKFLDHPNGMDLQTAVEARLLTPTDQGDDAEEAGDDAA